MKERSLNEDPENRGLSPGFRNILETLRRKSEGDSIIDAVREVGLPDPSLTEIEGILDNGEPSGD